MSTRLSILALLIVGLLIYSNSLLNGFIGDDFDQIVTNQKTHSLLNIPFFFIGSTYDTEQSSRLFGLYYRPVMISFFSIFYTFFQEDAFYYHLIQIVIHVMNTSLLFLLFSHYFKKQVSFVLALIFLVHPINNESVVYIANLQDVLFFFFGMLALILLLKKNLSKQRIIASSVLLFVSLLSKESGILFVCITLLYIFLFKKQNIKYTCIPVVVILLIYSFIRFFLIGQSQIGISPISHASIQERFITLPAIIMYYLKTFTYPFNLSIYQFWTIKNLDIQNFFVPTLMVALFTGSLLYVWKKIKKSKNNSRIYIFFVLWLGIGLLFHSNIYPLDMTVADRWFYFPIVGILGIIVIIYESILAKIISKKPIRLKFTGAVVGVILVLLSARTIIRNFDWKNNITLYTHDLQSGNENFFLLNSLGAELLLQKQYREAKPYIVKSIEQYPYFGNLNNMAIIYFSEKNIPKTKEYLEKALQKGENHIIYVNYSNFLLKYETATEAAKFTKHALLKYPKSSKLRKNLSTIENSSL